MTLFILHLTEHTSAGDDGNEGSDGEEDKDGNDRGGSENKNEDMMEGKYEEEDVAIYVDDEDEWVDEQHPKGL